MPDEGPAFEVGQSVLDVASGEEGVVFAVDYDEGFEDRVYGVRFPDGSEGAYGDVALRGAGPEEGTGGTA